MTNKEAIEELMFLTKVNGFKSWPMVSNPEQVEALKLAIKALESERPRGDWIVDEDNDILRFMKCSNCGEVAEWLDGGSQFISNFCPNCGADMRGGASDANG